MLMKANFFTARHASRSYDKGFLGYGSETSTIVAENITWLSGRTHSMSVAGTYSSFVSETQREMDVRVEDYDLIHPHSGIPRGGRPINPLRG